MLEAVLGLLERLERAAAGGAAALEDMHYADAATRGLATFLARVSRGQRVMLVLTYQPDRLLRSDPLRATLASLATTPSVVSVEVGPLDRAELGQLIEAIEGGRPSSTTLLLVAERSRGNPLVAEELLAASASYPASLSRLVRAARDGSLLSPLPGVPPGAAASVPGREPVTWPMLMLMATEFERRSPARPPALDERRSQG